MESFISYFVIQNQGDIVLTPKNAHKLVEFRQISNEKYSAAFTSTNDTLWTDNKANGYYIIGYIINDKLDDLNKQTIPKVKLKFNLRLVNL